MKKAFMILFILGIVIGIFLTSLILSSKFLIKEVLSNILGAEVDIKALSIDVRNHTFFMNDFKIYNPIGFDTEKMLAYLPEIRGAYDPAKLIKHRKFHVRELRVIMETLAVVKDKDGKLNIDRLRISLEDLEAMPIEFDRLILTVNEVIYSDFSKKGQPDVELYAVNIKNKDYEDLPSVEDVASKILTESLGKTAIKGAAIVGVATVAGVSLAGPIVIPVGAAIILSGKDSYEYTFNLGYEAVYSAAMKYADSTGARIHADKNTGTIRGSMNGASVVIKVSQEEKAKTKVRVTARKILLPAPRIAGGVLYEIFDETEAAKKSS